MEIEGLTPADEAFFLEPTEEVARALLGCYLLSDAGGVRTGGRIVESEAYLNHDPASHSYRGERPRNRSMFAPGGTLYVYLIYGVHFCLNVVTAPAGVGEAVLLRALEPVWGVETMARRRGRRESVEGGGTAPPPPAGSSRRGAPRLKGLTDGPGKLASALGVTASQDGSSLISGPVRLYLPPQPLTDERIVATPRIGITKAAEEPLRFVDRESRYLSRKLRG